MELNATDRANTDQTQGGACITELPSRGLGKQQPYISQRLSRLLESGCIVRVHRGLYGHSATEGEAISVDSAVEQFSDRELIDGPPQSISGSTQDSEETQPQPSPTGESEIESLVDQISLVPKTRKRRSHRFFSH